jgi:hypothetical protein
MHGLGGFNPDQRKCNHMVITMQEISVLRTAQSMSGHFIHSPGYRMDWLVGCRGFRCKLNLVSEPLDGEHGTCSPRRAR